MIFNSPNIKAKYRFKGNANDISGNGYNGSLVNNTKLTSDEFGRSNSAYDFDGNADRIDIGQPAFTSDFTITARFKADSFSGGYENIIAKGRSASTDGNSTRSNYCLFYQSSVPALRFQVFSTGGRLTATGPSLSTGIWYSATCKFIASEKKAILIVNGVSYESVNPAFGTIYNPSSGARIGNDIRNDSRMDWNGQISEVELLEKKESNLMTLWRDKTYKYRKEI